MNRRAVVAELAGSLEGDVLTDPCLVAGYRQDEAFVAGTGEPLCVARVRSVADVVATMRWATRHRVPVVPRGAGTGLAGGANATDGCVVLCLDRMTAIREISVDDLVADVEPGVRPADLARAARERGLSYPVELGSAERCTIGGNVGTNAGGFCCVRYGSTRDSVLGLDVVLADGRLLRTGRRTAKGVTGFDLTSLFVGSEGALGLVVGATLRLRLAPTGTVVTCVAMFRDAVRAARAVGAVLRSGLTPRMLELVDEVAMRVLEDERPSGLPVSGAALLIGQFDPPGPPGAAQEMVAACRAAGALWTDVTTDPEEAEVFLDIRRSALVAVGRLGHNLIEDFVVPPARLPEMLTAVRDIADRQAVLVATVAHAGDGNLHPTFVFDDRAHDVPERVWAAADEMLRTALPLGGTLTGEHGIGVLKRRWLQYEIGDTGLEVHRAVKAALDPLGLLNPGKAL